MFPAGRVTRHDTSIAFLGDILERIIPGNEKPFIPGYVSLEDKGDRLESGESGFINIRPENKEFLYPMDGRSSLDLNAYRKKEIARVHFSDFFIKGDARDRVIIYKPDLDRVRVLPSDFASDFSANIKFRISKDGFVKYTECVTSSGFYEIDQAAMRYVKKWQFVPAAEDNQEGVVRVSFK